MIVDRLARTTGTTKPPLTRTFQEHELDYYSWHYPLAFTLGHADHEFMRDYNHELVDQYILREREPKWIAMTADFGEGYAMECQVQAINAIAGMFGKGGPPVNV